MIGFVATFGAEVVEVGGGGATPVLGTVAEGGCGCCGSGAAAAEPGSGLISIPLLPRGTSCVWVLSAIVARSAFSRFSTLAGESVTFVGLASLPVDLLTPGPVSIEDVFADLRVKVPEAVLREHGESQHPTIARSRDRVDLYLRDNVAAKAQK
jgi:hypothetical protein